MKKLSILTTILSLATSLVCTPPEVMAAPDYTLSLTASELSSSEASSEVKLTAVVKRQTLARRRARKSRRKNFRLTFTFPRLTGPVKLPRSCSAGNSGSSVTVFECKLKKPSRHRGKRISFTVSSTAACDSEVVVAASFSKKNGREPDRFPENNSDIVSFLRNCSSTPENPENPENPGNPNPPTPPRTDCTPLTVTTGTVHEVSTVGELRQAVNAANQGGGATILLADGTFTLDQGLQITGNNIVVRSKSGDRNSVILRGQGMSGGTSHVFWIVGDDITIADMTIGYVANHAVQVHGEQDSDRTRLYNLRILDVREQFVKGSIGIPGASRANGGVIECSLFDFTAGGAIQNYTGGIDIHYGKNWTVRDNVFRNIKSPNGTLAEHAIHFWTDSEGSVVERNLIVNCDRGIGFGLGDRGHSGGVIRNNFIYHDATSGDVGIGVENASNVKIYHNTIFFENGYPNAIEYRFGGTSADIRNNLTNEAITERNGANATLADNITSASSSWFQDTGIADLHLSSSGLSQAGGQGAALVDAPDDYDGDTRPAGRVDVGADEAG